jgi:hypothetical protein
MNITRLSPSTAASRSPSAVQSEPAVVVVVGDPVAEAQRVLVDRLQARALERGQRRGVRRVGVQDAAQVGPGDVHAAVDVQGRGFDRTVAGEDAAVDIDAQQIARPQFAEMVTVRVDQELPAVVAQREAEMIAHALVEAAAHRETKRRRQLHPPVPLAIVHGLPPPIGA